MTCRNPAWSPVRGRSRSRPTPFAGSPTSRRSGFSSAGSAPWLPSAGSIWPDWGSGRCWRERWRTSSRPASRGSCYELCSPDPHTQIVEAAHALRAQLPDGLESPRVAIVLGSGLGALADRLTDAATIPYDLIPHFPRPTVAGTWGTSCSATSMRPRSWRSRGGFTITRGMSWKPSRFPSGFCGSSGSPP